MRCGSGILCDEPPNERGGQFVNRADYQAYLASREWALKREAVRERAHGRVNGMDAVHHRTYERVGNEHLDDLVAICDPCQEYLSGKRHTDPLTDGVAIYLAGPFLKPDWRQDLLAERQAIHGSPMLDDGNFTVMKRGLRGGFDAAGPWRLQTHGTNDHGILTDHGGGLCWCCDGAGAVVGVCKRSIARSDAVFAWLLKTVISAHRYFVGTWICRSAQEADCRRCSHRST
jgi:hypothetical protein